MEASQIIGLLLALLLSTLSGVILARSARMEKRIDDMYDHFADLRADLPTEYVRKDEYWMYMAELKRNLDGIRAGVDEINSREGNRDE